MKNATHNHISRLLPLVVLVGLALTAPTVSAGVNRWTTNGPGGRDIRALAIDPTNPAKLYADTEGAGVFKSTNGGGSWNAVNTGLTNSGVLALAIDPSAPATLYAVGTEGGVFKSTNGDGSWTAINAVLNGCGVNSRYWTFAGGLTDVNVILIVTDMQTGAIKTYTNPQRIPFQPVQDTNAFATCP